MGQAYCGLIFFPDSKELFEACTIRCKSSNSWPRETAPWHADPNTCSLGVNAHEHTQRGKNTPVLREVLKEFFVRHVASTSFHMDWWRVLVHSASPVTPSTKMESEFWEIAWRLLCKQEDMRGGDGKLCLVTKIENVYRVIYPCRAHANLLQFIYS